jgi:hypothetical protein
MYFAGYRRATLKEVEKQLAVLPRAEIARQAIDNSYIVITNTLDEAMDFSNEYAPEHLILATEKWSAITPKIINAGSVFLGQFNTRKRWRLCIGHQPYAANQQLFQGLFGRIGRFVCKEDHLPVFNRRRHTKHRPGCRNTGGYGRTARTQECGEREDGQALIAK